MAAYPDIGRRVNVEPVNQRRVDVSDAGTPRAVDLGEQVAYRIDVAHPLITDADVAVLEAFYETNKAATITITNRGITYNAIFESAYRVQDYSAMRSNAEVTLIGSRA